MENGVHSATEVIRDALEPRWRKSNSGTADDLAQWHLGGNVRRELKEQCRFASTLRAKRYNEQSNSRVNIRLGETTPPTNAADGPVLSQVSYARHAGCAPPDPLLEIADLQLGS